MNITISTQTFFVGAYQYGGSTATIRIYATKPFIASDGTAILGGAVGSNAFFKSVACTVASNTLTCPSFTLPSTTDALDDPTARFIFVLYDYRGTKRDILYANTTGGQLSIPANLGTTLSFAQIALSNQASQPLRDTSVYTKTEVNTQIALALGELSSDLRIGIDSANYVSLAAAVTAIGATPTDLVITNSFPSGATTTVPSTLHLTFKPSGQLNLTTGHVVTIQSDGSNWPDRKIFNNALNTQGTISFSGPKAPRVINPQWWGAVTDGVTDDTAYLRAAAVATPKGGILQLPWGTSVVTAGSGQAIVTVTVPIWVRGYREGTFLKITTGTATNVPLFKLVPPDESAAPNGAFGQNFGWKFSDFTAYSGDNLSGGDIIQIAPTSQTTTAYMVEVCNLETAPTGGKDVHVANQGPISTNGSVHLNIHDNSQLKNGIWLEHGSDSLKLERNFFLTGSQAAPHWKQILFEASFLNGAANITIRDNTFVNGAIIFHSGINITFESNYVESEATLGSNGAVLDLRGDSALINGATIASNLFVTNIGAGTLNGVRCDNVVVPDFSTQNYFTQPAGKFGIVTTANTKNPVFGGQNLAPGGSGTLISDGCTSDGNGALYSAGTVALFAGLPARPFPGSTFWVLDGTPNSNPLTGGGSGTIAVYLGGLVYSAYKLP